MANRSQKQTGIRVPGDQDGTRLPPLQHRVPTVEFEIAPRFRDGGGMAAEALVGENRTDAALEKRLGRCSRNIQGLRLLSFGRCISRGDQCDRRPTGDPGGDESDSVE